MKHNCFVKYDKLDVPICLGTYEALTSERVMFEGRVVSRSVYVFDDPIERVKDVNLLDFSLENQLAAGVDLRDCTMDSSAFVACASLPVVNPKIVDYGKDE